MFKRDVAARYQLIAESLGFENKWQASVVLIEQGLSVNAIGNLFGTHGKTIRKWYNEIPKRKRREVPTCQNCKKSSLCMRNVIQGKPFVREVCNIGIPDDLKPAREMYSTREKCSESVSNNEDNLHTAVEYYRRGGLAGGLRDVVRSAGELDCVANYSW
jgi:hypothetical protein